MPERPPAAVWNDVLAWIRERLDPQEFTGWFRDLRCQDITAREVTLCVPSKFFQEWMEREYLSLLKSALLETTRTTPLIAFTIIDRIPASAPEHQPPKLPELPAPSQAPPPTTRTLRSADLTLNEHYTFKNFVTGPCNRLAHAAAVAITENPSQAYNPFFIHSNVGLGKSHLMQAICHVFLARYPEKRILYLSCEEFVNRFIKAVERKAMETFRHKYRHVDLLLIDDIHFLAAKDRTQDEFFHTFNTLYNAQKQIILSSDSPPKEIPTIEERLVSRFKWGLVTRMDPPAYETRVAIIKTKARIRNHVFPEDVVQFIAQHISANIRELEGAVTKIIGHTVLEKKPLTLELTREALRDIIQVSQRINIVDIQNLVVHWFNIRHQDLTSRRRTRNIAFPRHVAMYLARKLTPLSLSEIGHYFGGRDHTTVLHGWEKISRERATNPELAATLDDLIRKIEHRN